MYLFIFPRTGTSGGRLRALTGRSLGRSLSGPAPGEDRCWRSGAMWLLAVLVPLLRLYLCGLKVLWYQMMHRSFRLPVLPQQKGRVGIVTGGTRGMGLETARRLAGLGMHVIIAGNEREEGAVAIRTINAEGGEGKAEFMFVDLTSLKSVRRFAQAFRDRGLPLHVLVNNAGTMLVPERRTEDGFEFHWSLNYLSHFLLTNLLLDLLKSSGGRGHCSRIVNMSSATHYAGELHLDDLNRRICYSSHGAYAQSKLALVLFTYYLQEQLSAGGFHVTANAVDPGMVDTALYDNLWTLAQMLKRPVAKVLFRTPAEGASISVYAAAAAEVEGVGGCYLYNGRKTPSSESSYDAELQEQLWKKSCQLVGLQGPGADGAAGTHS